jgi:hypothetical protein
MPQLSTSPRPAAATLVVCALALAALTGCQTMFPDLYPSDAETSETARTAARLRPNSHVGEASGLSSQAREIERNFGFR